MSHSTFKILFCKTFKIILGGAEYYNKFSIYYFSTNMQKQPIKYCSYYFSEKGEVKENSVWGESPENFKI